MDDALWTLLSVFLGGGLTLAGGYLSRQASRREAEAERQAAVIRTMVAHASESRFSGARSNDDEKRLNREADESLFDAWLYLPDDLRTMYVSAAGGQVGMADFMEEAAAHVKATRRGWWARLSGRGGP